MCPLHLLYHGTCVVDEFEAEPIVNRRRLLRRSRLDRENKKCRQLNGERVKGEKRREDRLCLAPESLMKCSWRVCF